MIVCFGGITHYRVYGIPHATLFKHRMEIEDNLDALLELEREHDEIDRSIVFC